MPWPGFRSTGFIANRSARTANNPPPGWFAGSSGAKLEYGGRSGRYQRKDDWELMTVPFSNISIRQATTFPAVR